MSHVGSSPMKSRSGKLLGASYTVAGTTRPQLWLSRELCARSHRTLALKCGGDGGLALFLGPGGVLPPLHGMRLGRSLALLVRALADLEALDRVGRDKVVVDDVALGGVLGVAVADGVVKRRVLLAAAAHVERNHDLAALDLDRRSLLDDAHVRRRSIHFGEALVHHRLHLGPAPVGAVTDDDLVPEGNHVLEID